MIPSNQSLPPSLVVDRILSLSKSDPLSVLTTESAENFWIYVNNFIGPHLEQLFGVYKCALKFLGEKNFEGLAYEYMSGHPPQSALLIDYAHDFGSFLSKHEKLSEYFFLHDLCALDWLAYRSAYFTEQVEVKEGVIELWTAIRTDSAIEQIQINDSETVQVTCHLEDDQVRFIWKRKT